MKKKEIEEIKYNIINSLLAGGLTLFGAFTSGGSITWESCLVALCASCLVALAKFQKYWETKPRGKNNKGQLIFCFI